MCNTNKPCQCQGVLFGFFLEISVKKDNRKKKYSKYSNSGETMTAVGKQSTNRLAKEQDTNPAEQTHTVSTESDLVNVFTIADHFNVHYRTAQRWTRNKWIPHYKVGKSVRYSLKEVMNATASPRQVTRAIASVT